MKCTFSVRRSTVSYPRCKTRCGRGEIGRRARFRFWWGNTRGGSSPLARITKMSNWTPKSWQMKETLQQPSYEDVAALESAVNEIALFPPLVSSWEIENFREGSR